jgi:hypothetical protein
MNGLKRLNVEAHRRLLWPVLQPRVSAKRELLRGLQGPG